MGKKRLITLLCCTLVLLSGCSCKHTNTTLVNVISAECEKEGYSGDLYCNDCKETLERGTLVAALEHVPGDVIGAFEATCISAGQTGDVFCTLCNSRLNESEEIPAKGHVFGELSHVQEATCTREGYTGDRECTVCGAIEQGTVIPKAEHQFVENICKACEWRVPGMYVDDHLEIRWDELVDAGFIKVKDHTVTEVADSITGLLVVDEGIERIQRMHGRIQPMEGELDHLDGVYLPQTLKEIDGGAFERSSVRSIRFFGECLEKVGARAFERSGNLEEISWPKTVNQIESGTFSGCTSLHTIDIPENVEKIGFSAFSGCIALKHIDLPQNLSTIDGMAFAESGLECIDIPDGVVLADYADGIFKKCTSLTDIDLSGCTVANGVLVDTVKGCTALKHVVFPQGIIKINNAVEDCIALEELIIPEGVKEFSSHIERYMWDKERNGELTSLEKVVWPVTLTDGTALLKAAPNLKTIYYTGSQTLWNLTTSKDLFDGVDKVFDFVLENTK